MIYEFEKIRLGSIVKKIFDIGSNGSDAQISKNLNMHDYEDYALMVRTVNFNSNNFENNVKYISKESYDFFKKSKLYGDEIIINKIGSPGTIGYMPKLNRPVSLGLNQYAIGFTDDVDNRFMYYYLKFNESYMKSLAHGSVTKSITQDDIKNAKVIIPRNKEYQIEIRKFLDNIDSLIINYDNILSKIKDYLMLNYNYWFEQFEYPGNDGKKIFDKKINKYIPDGWKSVNIKELCDFYKGVEPGMENYFTEAKPGMVEFYRVSDLENDNAKTFIDNKLFENENRAKIGDLLITFDGTVGKIDMNCDGFYSTGIKKIKMKNSKLSDVIAFCFFNSDYSIYTLKKHTTGSVIKHGSRGIDYLYLPFNEEIFMKFSDIYGPVYTEMISYIKQLNMIKSIRDFYTPLLLNGQLLMKKG